MKRIALALLFGIAGWLNQAVAVPPPEAATQKTPEVSIELRVVTPSAELLRGVKLPTATAVPDSAISEDRDIGEPSQSSIPENDSPIRLVNATTVVEKRIPISVQTVPLNSLAEFFKAAQSDAKTSIQSPPKLRLKLGTVGEIDATIRRPFVTNLQFVSSTEAPEGVDQAGSRADTVGIQPKIRIVREGVTLKVRSHVVESGRIALDLLLNLDEITDVGVVPVAANAVVQVPEVKTTQIEISARLSEGEVLLIRNAPAQPKGPKRNGFWSKSIPNEPDNFPLIVLVSAHKVEP